MGMKSLGDLDHLTIMNQRRTYDPSYAAIGKTYFF